jgi:predicted flap endonuclease-1-like 5' DNA nuclease
MVISINHPIAHLPGLTKVQAEQLSACGISTTYDLLRQGSSIRQRQQLSAQLSTHIKHINKWTALANLARVPGVGTRHCGLLLNAGVSSPQQLATMSVQKLHPLLLRLQIQLLNRADLAPDTAQVATWIQQAQQMMQPVEASPDTKTCL